MQLKHELKRSNNMKDMSIGAVAKKTGISIDTIRYYERNGLIDEPSRSSSGYRQYPSEALSQIKFIKRGKDLTFTLKEIKELMNLSRDPEASCVDFKDIATGKLDEIDANLLKLKRVKSNLKKLTVACPEKGAIENCPIRTSLVEGT